MLFNSSLKICKSILKESNGRLLVKQQLAIGLHSYRNFVQKTVTSKNTTKKHFKKLFFTSIFGGIIIYDGLINEFGYCGAGVRFFRSLKIACVIVADYNYTLWRLDENDETYKKKLKEVNQRSADRVLDGCLANGGLYIKLGQGISAINHILPKEYTETLKKLQNECLPRKKDEVRRLFLQDFGKTPEELFDKFNYEPIAAASLAQVFRATTKDGEDVAVKVQYIDLQKRFTSDLGTIKILQDIIELIHKNYNFGWILKDLRENLLKELDFANEGLNSERCAKDLSKFKFLYVPKVMWNLTSKRVLTAEYCDGFKISDMKQMERLNFDISDVNIKLFTAFSEQIFKTGFVHADPHPGNVLVRKGNDGKAQLVLIDHGLYENLPVTISNALCNFWEAIVLNDISAMEKYAKKLNVDDYREFAEILLQKPLTINKVNTNHQIQLKTKLTDEDINYMTQKAKEHFDIIMNTLKDMPRNMLFVVRNLNTIRSIAREHGDPVDRTKFMARYAVKTLYQNKNNSFFQNILSFKRYLYFEYKLWKMNIQYWILYNYVNLLRFIGRAPETKKLFDEINQI